MNRFAIKSFDSTPPASLRSFAVSLKTAIRFARSVSQETFISASLR